MKYTEEEKKQLRAMFARMLDAGEETGCIEIMEADSEAGVPFIKRSQFRISVVKLGAVEKR